MDEQIIRALDSGPTYIGLLALVVGARSTRSRDFRDALGRLAREGRIELADPAAGTWQLSTVELIRRGNPSYGRS